MNGLENTYYHRNGKHQEKALEVFKLITIHGKFYKDSKGEYYKGENLLKLARLMVLYGDVCYYIAVQKIGLISDMIDEGNIFDTALLYANSYYSEKDRYHFKDLIELEQMVDNLVLKAYDEQKKLGSI